MQSLFRYLPDNDILRIFKYNVRNQDCSLKNPLAFKKQRIKSVIKFSFHHFRNGANQERRNFELKPQQRQNPVKAVKSLLMPLVNYSF